MRKAVHINQLLERYPRLNIRAQLSKLKPLKIARAQARFVSARLQLRFNLFLAEMGASRKHSLPGTLIVTLTSHPKRYRCLKRSLQSLLSQSIRPDKVILWIAEGEDYTQLPKDVLELESDVFTIKQCTDYRVFNKFRFTIEQFPKAFVVICDDDLFYSRDWLANLLVNYRGDHRKLLAHRVHRIVLDQNCLPLPYNQWDGECVSTQESSLLFPTGAGGVLIPPGSLDSRVLSLDFLDLCPTADDIWLYWMMRMNGSTAQYSGHLFDPFNWPESQNDGLNIANVAGGANDQQIRNMIERFGFPPIH